MNLHFPHLDGSINGKWNAKKDQSVLSVYFGASPALAVSLPEPPTAQDALSYLGDGSAHGCVLAQQTNAVNVCETT